MANRSTRGSVLPRDIKRFLDLTPGDAHHIGYLRRLFIDAHNNEKTYRNKRLTQMTNVDEAGEEPASIETVSV